MTKSKTAKLDLRLRSDDRVAIERLADRNGRSMAAEVRAAIARHIRAGDDCGSAET